jgi:hypothetical protein
MTCTHKFPMSALPSITGMEADIDFGRANNRLRHRSNSPLGSITVGEGKNFDQHRKPKSASLKAYIGGVSPSLP